MEYMFQTFATILTDWRMRRGNYFVTATNPYSDDLKADKTKKGIP